VVSSYPEDKDVSTVLVEGSVGLYKGGEEFSANSASILRPGHRATWDKSQQDISIEAVSTEKYTAWMNGRIIFSHLPFKEIVRKLERHYNVTITNRNTELDEEFFTASFDTENIEQVLQAFSRSYPFKYEITDKEIFIN
jgi:ferric-dicitrate binding protein FerR (iron transport regulator)